MFPCRAGKCGIGSLELALWAPTAAPFALQKLEDCDRKAVHQIDQLQREQRHLKRQLEKLGIERVRMDSVGSTVSSERSDSDRGELPARCSQGHSLAVGGAEGCVRPRGNLSVPLALGSSGQRRVQRGEV